MRLTTLLKGIALAMCAMLAGCENPIQKLPVPDLVLTNPVFRTGRTRHFKAMQLSTVDRISSDERVSPDLFRRKPDLDLSRMKITGRGSVQITFRARQASLVLTEVTTAEQTFDKDKNDWTPHETSGIDLLTLGGLQPVYSERQLADSVVRQTWSHFKDIKGHLFPPAVGNRLEYHVTQDTEQNPPTNRYPCGRQYDITNMFDIIDKFPGTRIHPGIKGDVFVISAKHTWKFIVSPPGSKKCSASGAVDYAYYYYIPSLDISIRARVLSEDRDSYDNWIYTRTIDSIK